MQDLESQISEVIENFSFLIRRIVANHVFQKDGIDLEDIEQEVKIKIWTFLKKGKKVDKLPSYIKKVALTTTIDELRKMLKQSPSRELPDLKKLYSYGCLEDGGKEAWSPEHLLRNKEMGLLIQEAVESLGENRKRVLRLYLRGMSVEDISNSLSWDKTKVRHLLYRGIDDLRQKIGPDKERRNEFVGGGEKVPDE